MQIHIADGCIACNVCESICPEVFTIHDECEADNSALLGHEEACRQAAQECPVCVIIIQE